MTDVFAPQDVVEERDAHGARVFRARTPLGDVPPSAADALARARRAYPERVFLAERDAGGAWVALTYGDAFARARAVAQGLLARGARPDRPVLVVAPNGIAHALVTLGALHVGVPIVPVAPDDVAAWHVSGHLAAFVARVSPAFAFADPASAAVLAAVPVATVTDVAILETPPTAAVDAAAARVSLDTIAKIVFTSGTTGARRGVVTTHRMLVANQTAFAQVWPLGREAPVLVDWLPWSHSFGGSKVFHFAMHRGGTLYVDAGRPATGRFATTLANLREIAPTVYFGVPRAYAMLVPALEADAALRARFFSRLRFAFNAAAALSPGVARAFAAVATRAGASAVPVIAGWGATETAPGATCVHAFDAPLEAIGVPLPGVEIKLAPLGDGRDELRVRGPNVMPGYWNDATASRAAFDADGFYRSGDLGRLVDDARPERGFVFAGRLAENFKLANGAWVRAAEVRAALLDAAAPLLADVVVTGDDGDEVGALAFLDLDAARAFAHAPAATHAELASDDAVRAHVARALATLAATTRSRTDRVACAVVVTDAPSRATGEITEKGTINRAVALRLRAAAVACLHARPAGRAVIRPETPASRTGGAPPSRGD